MSESVYEQISLNGKYLGMDIAARELALFAHEREYDESTISAINDVFQYLRDKREEAVVNSLLGMSRLPLKEPKTFEGFDYSRLRSKNIEALRNLSTLAPLYAKRNLAFIGPQGVGKTHLAMAFGRACCLKGMKAYYLKATELRQKLSDALKYGREGSTVNGLVRPSCLIIDEIGRCKLDKECTRLFFDMVDKRCEKEGPNTMIFTSNKTADKWGEYFSENDSLLCSLDRIFDNASVFMFKGESYRGKGLETVLVEAGTSGVSAKK